MPNFSPSHVLAPVPRPLRAVLVAALAACTGSGQAAEKAAARQPEPFVGTLVYEVGASGGNAEGVEMFRAAGPQRETVTWGSGGRLRLETVGGWMAGVTVARFADSAFFVLDTAARTAEKATVQSLNLEDAPPEMRVFMEARLGPAEVERTDEEGTYAGRRCRMYTVRKSSMLRSGATARACVAEDVRVRPTRYSFQNGGFGRMAPLPLQFGIREGLPLMLEVNEQNTIVTYRAVSLTPGEPADSLFSVPAGYTVPADSAG
ncbi:MAG TPA: hypothetical protein VFQ45_23760 [Longimicrobium sp.]|nr:hypothetical protein [Longimicrobium sp.]